MTLDLLPWVCDACGRTFVTQLCHFPHDPDCPGGDCDCDNTVCESCCWAPECEAAS